MGDLNVVVYMSAEFETATRKVAGRGAKFFSCPPLREDRLNGLLSQLETADLILFNLHGLAGGAAWFANSEGPPVAIRANQLEALDLSSAVVFIENCYAGDANNPMKDALKQAGAKMIIAGAGENYGGKVQPVGADILFLIVRHIMMVNKNINFVKATMTNAILLFGVFPDCAARDTSQFTIWTKE